MVTRKECQVHYQCLGIPTKDITFSALFRVAENKHLQLKNQCLEDVEQSYSAIKQNTDFQIYDGRSAHELFDLEKGETDYVDEIKTALLDRCDSTYKSSVAKSKYARDFLKDYHAICTTNSACADSYTALDMPKGGDQAEIKSQFKFLSKSQHPDHTRTSDATERQKQLNEAYKFLKDPKNNCDKIDNLQDFFTESASEVGMTPKADNAEL